jgi:hypothetical protein
MSVKEISKRAQAIRKKSPSKMWTDCIKQAARELKKEKVKPTSKAVSGAVKKKTVRTNQPKSSQPDKNILGLKGLKGQPVGMILNGIGKLVKGGYYYQQNPVTGEPVDDTLFHYRGKVGSAMFPLHFDLYFRNSRTGKFSVKPVLYELALDTAITLIKVKKPTSRELAIGHLKLLK